MIQQRFFIITGGPGAGKTSLLNALQARGYKTIPEIARQIIQQQVLQNGSALPWKNKLLYAQLMLAASIESYNETVEMHPFEPVIFFDRGIPDTLGYVHLADIPLEESVYTEATNYRYNPVVFILPPWKEIYQKDTERKQNWSEAVATYYQLKETYEKLGYTLVDVPVGSINDRALFLLKNCDTNKPHFDDQNRPE